MSAAVIDAPTSLAEALDLLPDPEYTVALEKVAARISKEFHYITTAEDLYSEWILWLAEHPGHAKRWHFIGDDGVPRFGWKSFQRDAAAIMAAVARKEKAQAFGYDPEDEYFYGKAQVQEYLLYIWQDSVLTAVGAEGEKVSTANDPAKGNNMAAHVLDVRLAYAEIIIPGSSWDRVLVGMYRDGETQAEIADATGVSQSAISQRHTRALDALLVAVNGTKPMHEGPGARTVLSNAGAIRVTHNQED